VIENPIAYTITDKIFEKLEVKNSANAWWLEKTKVEALIQVFKFDGTQEEACSYAGITQRQYDYFIEQHPQFCEIIGACREIPNLKARKTAVSKIEESYQNAMDYLKRKKKKEFGDRMEVDNPAQVEAIKSLENIIKEIRK